MVMKLYGNPDDDRTKMILALAGLSEVDIRVSKQQNKGSADPQTESATQWYGKIPQLDTGKSLKSNVLGES